MQHRVVSSSAGRMRLDLPATRARPDLAHAVEAALATVPSVRTVTANPTSGRILVLFDPASGSEPVLEQIVAVLAEPLVLAEPTGPAGSPLRRVLDVGLPARDRLARPAASTMVGQAISMLQNLAVITSASIAGQDPPSLFPALGFTDGASQARALAGAGLGLSVAQVHIQQRRTAAWQQLARDAEHRLRTEVFQRLEQQDLAFFDSHGTGAVFNALTVHVDNIGRLIESGDGLIESVMTILIGGTALALTSPRLALIVGAALPFAVIATRRLGPQTKEAFAATAVPASNLTQALDNILGGLVEVKSFTAEELEADRVADMSATVAASQRSAAGVGVRQAILTGSAFQFMGTAALALGATLALDGKIPSARFTRSLYWVPTLLQAFGAAANLSRTLYAASTSAARLVEVLDSVPAITSGPTRLDPASVRGEIRIEDISFGYDATREALRHVTVHLPAGSSLGIVGPSGSGKSTLLRLLLRFYDPAAGRILLDGNDVRDVALPDLRAAISLVSQEVYIFDGTLGHNVRYGRPDASEEDVLAAMAAANATELLDVLPDGLATQVGERGHRLSGGQRQRIALARAFLKGSPILALDEATSHLDYQAEASVKSALRTVASGKTVVLIAHRLSSVRDLDNIVVLDQATVREQGSHESLLEQRGLYHRLWQLQSN
jgi:ATP-binding cassette, subfamily B, bacterial